MVTVSLIGGRGRSFALALICVLAGALPALSQDCPPLEIYGGYSFLSLDTKSATARQGANGWEGGVAWSLNRRLAIEFEGSGYYTSYTSLLGTSRVRDFYLLAGPRINVRPIFVRALFGGDHLSDNIFSSSVFAQGFAATIGAGVDHRVKGPWSLRASFDYVLSRHSVYSSPSLTLNNFRASAGVGYTFGRDPSEY